MQELVEVGFWRAGGLDPAVLCDASSTRAEPDADMIQYITRAAFVESAELGFSFCRIPGCMLQSRGNPAMGSATMSDGVYVWPEGLHHYVGVHGLPLPPRFLEHIRDVCKVWQDRAASRLDARSATASVGPCADDAKRVKCDLPLLNVFTLERPPEPDSCCWTVAPLASGWVKQLQRVSHVLVMPSSAADTAAPVSGSTGSAAVSSSSAEGCAVCSDPERGSASSLATAQLWLSISLEVAAAARAARGGAEKAAAGAAGTDAVASKRDG